MQWSDAVPHSTARASDGAHLHIEAALFSGIFTVEIVWPDGEIRQHVLHGATLDQAKAKAQAMLRE